MSSMLTQKRERAKSRQHPAGLRVGSFGARRDCGYRDARALPIYNSKKIASGKGGEKIKGVCKKNEAIHSRRGCKVA